MQGRRDQDWICWHWPLANKHRLASRQYSQRSCLGGCRKALYTAQQPAPHAIKRFHIHWQRSDAATFSLGSVVTKVSGKEDLFLHSKRWTLESHRSVTVFISKEVEASCGSTVLTDTKPLLVRLGPTSESSPKTSPARLEFVMTSVTS